jgi:hypothetical protein
LGVLEGRFDAEVLIDKSPAWLSTLVIESALLGRRVRAKVEGVTRQVPAAMEILKR